jgi:hypothetical protein
MEKRTYTNLGISIMLTSLLFLIFIPIGSCSTSHAVRSREVYANKGIVDKGYLENEIDYYLYETGSTRYFTDYSFYFHYQSTHNDFEWFLADSSFTAGYDALNHEIWLKIDSWGNLREVDHHARYVHVTNGLTVFNDESYSGTKSLSEEGGISGVWWAGAKNYYHEY